jgi:hypothetical protein
MATTALRRHASNARKPAERRFISVMTARNREAAQRAGLIADKAFVRRAGFPPGRAERSDTDAITRECAWAGPAAMHNDAPHARSALSHAACIPLKGESQCNSYPM